MKVLLFNPRSADAKHRIPNSILQVGGALRGKFEPIFVDGNLEQNPQERIASWIEEEMPLAVGVTVMPGPQLKQAIPISKFIKTTYPQLPIIWGGYFASNQYKTVLDSGWVDFVVDGPCDDMLVTLLTGIHEGWDDFSPIPNLIYRTKGQLIKTRKEALPNMEAIPDFPYEKLNSYYPLKNYLPKTFLGTKTLGYHSSFGCPFTCSFCAVVPIYNAKWKGLSAERMGADLSKMKKNYGIDAVEFHDNNFFTARKRVLEFAKIIKPLNLTWWGEGRIDTIDKYTDDDLHLLKKSGLKMIFLGAETGNDEVLKTMDKGGNQTGKQIRAFAARMKRIGLIPEYSFVLGLPGDSPKKVKDQIEQDIAFIKEIKKINPDTEIIIYLYSPVPTEGSELYKTILANGFSFPKHLEDWLSPAWENFDLRKNPLTPWLSAQNVQRIKDFETVLNAYYPTVSDFRIGSWKRRFLKGISAWRYHTGFYRYPYELKVVLKIMKYRKPEEQGFYSE